MSELQRGQDIFHQDADRALVKKVDKLVASGEAVWILDPAVEGVVGLVRSDDRRHALVVVYVMDSDFEVADELML
jgi:hypothetical protein